VSSASLGLGSGGSGDVGADLGGTVTATTIMSMSTGLTSTGSGSPSGSIGGTVQGLVETASRYLCLGMRAIDTAMNVTGLLDSGLATGNTGGMIDCKARLGTTSTPADSYDSATLGVRGSSPA
jgi:hypothetical protein